MNKINEEAFDANYEDLKVGDKIVVIHNDDTDLAEWLEEQSSQILTIETLEPESELLWAKGDCPYSIQMACVLKV